MKLIIFKFILLIKLTTSGNKLNIIISNSINYLIIIFVIALSTNRIDQIKNGWIEQTILLNDTKLYSVKCNKHSICDEYNLKK